MLKNELQTMEERKKYITDILEELWYSGLRNDVFDYIRTHICSDNPLCRCAEIMIISEEYLHKKIQNTNKGFFDHDDVIFNFLRSKLWNEGFNLLLYDNDSYIRVRKNEKYKDPFVINHNIPLYHELNYAEITGDYSNIEKILNDLWDVDIIKSEKTNKKSKSKKKNNKKSLNHSGQDIDKYTVGPVISSPIPYNAVYDYYTEFISNTTDTSAMDNSIHTYASVNYDAVVDDDPNVIK